VPHRKHVKIDPTTPYNIIADQLTTSGEEKKSGVNDTGSLFRYDSLFGEDQHNHVYQPRIYHPMATAKPERDPR
jgi:hypothetical protein